MNCRRRRLYKGVPSAYFFLFRYEADRFLRRIGTEHEKWALNNNPARKRQRLYSGKAAVSTPYPSLTKKKVLACVWWDFSGIVHYELLKLGQTVTSTVYCEQLERTKREPINKRSVLSVNNKKKDPSTR